MEWPDEAKNPLGEVIDILGIAGQNTAEMHAILAEFGLPYKYPSSVEKAADKIPEAISPEKLRTGRISGDNNLHDRPEGRERLRRRPFRTPFG